jgi:hypothetical protein
VTLASPPSLPCAKRLSRHELFGTNNVYLSSSSRFLNISEYLVLRHHKFTQFCLQCLHVAFQSRIHAISLSHRVSSSTPRNKNVSNFHLRR